MPTNITPALVTADELYDLPADGFRYELVQGVLSMMSPAGGRHGRLANRIAWILNNHVERHQLGVVFAAETGFLIRTDPDTVLAPDVAFVRQSRFETIEDESRYLTLAPDLAIEVLSPGDRYVRVEAKILAWLDAGCRMVLVVDPEAETIQACRSRHQLQIFAQDEMIDCNEAVPNWQLKVSEVFK